MSTILALMVVHAALIIKQPNLSTAIVIVAIMIGILFVGGLAWKYIVIAFGSLGVGMVSILLFLGTRIGTQDLPTGWIHLRMLKERDIKFHNP